MTIDQFTLVMTTQAVMTPPRPELTPNLTFLSLITYVLICNMPILDDKMIDTYDHPNNDHPGGHDHFKTLVDPGFDIPDLNYPQLDTKNVKIGPREGVIRF